MNKSPAFQFYPADYLSDMKVRMLSWASRGLYMDLLCYCWREGWIPSDSSAIAQLCGCHDLAIVEPCLSLFNSHPEDAEKLIHTRLDKERAKQKEHSDERKSSGIKGAEKRWGKNSSAIKQPLAKNGSSSSSSSSTSVKKEPLVFDPLPFDSEKFKETWNMWLTHKKEIGQKMPPTTVNIQLKKCAKWGEDKSILAIENAIAGKWQGLFEPKQEQSTHRPLYDQPTYVKNGTSKHRSLWD